MPYEFSANLTGEHLVTEICRALMSAGLHVAQAFDLRSAFALAAAPQCPHHSLASCDCQYSVLLVYGQVAGLVTLIIYGHEARCWIALVAPASVQPSPGLTAEIIRALTAARLIGPAIGERDG